MFRTLSLCKAAAKAQKEAIPVLGMRMGPYAIYCKENMGQHSGKKNVDAIKALATAWNKLSVDDKKVYQKESDDYFAKRVADFRKLSEEDQQKAIDDAKMKKEKRAKHKELRARREENEKSGRPTPPPNSYALFVKEKATGKGGIGITGVVKDAAKQWKGLSEEAKKKYSEEAKKLSDDFHAKLTQWKTEQAAQRKTEKADEKKMEKK